MEGCQSGAGTPEAVPPVPPDLVLLTSQSCQTSPGLSRNCWREAGCRAQVARLCGGSEQLERRASPTSRDASEPAGRRFLADGVLALTTSQGGMDSDFVTGDALRGARLRVACRGYNTEDVPMVQSLLEP